MYVVGMALYYLTNILYWAILIRCIMTWFPNGRGSQFYNALSAITEPIEGPIRSLMSRYTNGPMDFSPLIAIVLLSFVRRYAMMMVYM